MPAPIFVYVTSIAVLWIFVSTDEAHAQFQLNGQRSNNGSIEHPDPRSPVGRVPPYQPPAVFGPGPLQPQGFWPYNIHSRVDSWHHRPVFHKNDIIHHDDDEGDFDDNHNDNGGCQQPCPTGHFSCQISCMCIVMDKRCDGLVDCAEAEDESGCTSSCDEHENRTLCHGGNICISLNWICDGDNDCGDFSDETHCGGDANCTADQFECANGLCIHKDWVCDGDNDCRDSSDELNCTKNKCEEDQFLCANGKCIARDWRCDKEPDCLDESDEVDCPAREPIVCAETEFQCGNKNCLSKELLCDSDNDCGDWTDEDTCPMTPGSCNAGEFKCSDGKCIPERWRCDIEIDCTDGEDELNCNPNDIHNCSSDEYTCADRRCILQTWVCDGIRDCSNGEDEMSCIVNCEDDQFACKPHQDLTSSAFRNCVNRKHVCDGMKDCPRGDDEEKCSVKRKCTSDDRCEKICLTTYDGKPACDCPLGFLLGDDKYSCHDIDECMYEQDPVCSQTCSNTIGSYQCGCMTGYVLRPDGRSCKPKSDPPLLLFSNRVGVRQVWLTGDNYMSVAKGLHNAIALDYHYEKKLVFWAENNLKVIRVAQMNTKNMTDVIKWGIETPAGLAVDWIHDLLFWTDAGSRRVEVASLDGKHRAVLVANELDKPRAIAVHPGDALVFWTDWGPSPKIERSDMDGRRRRTLIFDQIFWPNGLTIDYIDSKIYWADAKHHVIEKSNFDGQNRQRVTSKGLPHPYALTVFEDAIYWTDWHTKSISTVHKNTGKGIQTVHGGLNTPMDIHAFHPLRQINTYKNRCGTNNGGCSHLCLPHSIGYTCRCPPGFNLKPDGLTCDDTPDKLLLYARTKDIRLKQLNPKKSVDALDMVIPVESIKSVAAIDWDISTKTIFWTDVNRRTICRAHLNGSNQATIIDTNLVSPTGLAYDWINEKLYWTDAGTSRIEVASVDGKKRTLLVWANIDRPRDIVLDPKAGVMYWSDWGPLPRIERADMDGGNRRQLIFGEMTLPSGLAIDFEKKRLYWVDGGNKTIEYANLDGSGRTVLIDENLGEHLLHPYGLDLHGDEIFWSDWVTQSIQAANKYSGKNRRTLGAGVAGLMDVRVFHKERVKEPNRCGTKNGGCSHLCLLKPGGYSCACTTGIKLKNDGKTCDDSPTNYLIFAHRLDIRVISLDAPYLVDVVLPLPRLKNALSVDVDQKTGLIYWTDTIEKKIRSANIKGTNMTSVISKKLVTVDGIAVDSIGRKIYWTDGGMNSIEVTELDGSNRKILVWTGLDSPRGIALHYERGYMFWSDWGTTAKIERADMDGQNRRIIVKNNIKWPNGLAIDKAEGRLYWSDAKLLTIESCDFNGNDRRTVLSDVPYPYGIVIVGQYIYWTDWKTKALHRADKTKPRDPRVIRGDLEGLMDIRYIQGGRKMDNVCGSDNGGCSNLCLRSPEGYTCACPIGLNFKNISESFPKTCKTYPEEFLVVASKGSITYISFDTPEYRDVTFPVKEAKNTLSLDFHWERKEIYYTDVDLDVIRAMKLTDMNETRVVVQSKLDTPNGLAVDWIADNVYWSDNGFKMIEVARLDGTSRKILITNLTEPRALALFPAKGLLFWSDWGESPRIEKSLLDGSERKTIIQDDLGFPNGLSIDYKERRLYWVDAIKDRIETSDLDGKQRVQLVIKALNPFGMTQFRDNVYWTDWYTKTVMRADKKTGKNATSFCTGLETAMEIKAVAGNKQHGWNPCKENNGGCSHLCFFKGHDYICACPDDPDPKPCSTVPAKRVENKIPAHYPSYYDYTDIVEDKILPVKPTAVTHTPLGTGLIVAATTLCTFLGMGVIIFICFKFRQQNQSDSKDHGEPTNHISFHNPNYNGTNGGGPTCNIETHDRRPPRFPGIFKYDRSQERVTNVYVPEGTSLLPPPPPPPQRQPPRPPTHDDFEPVTLHSYA